MSEIETLHPRLIAPEPVLGMTYEQFKEYLAGEQKGDLINGVAKIMAPAPLRHERVFRFLLTALQIFVEAKDLGEVLGSRTLVRIDDKNGYEPDILFVSKGRLHIVTEVELLEAPDVAVEIVSKSSRLDDRSRKFIGYEKARVREYWYLDPARGEAEFFRHNGEKLIEFDLVDSIFRSEAVTGFWLNPEWVLGERMPPVLETVRQMLPD